MPLLGPARLLLFDDAPARVPGWLPANLSDPLLRRLDWLGDEIDAAYGATTTRERALARLDFVHRHAIHPFPPFHDDAPTGYGAETLPAGFERAGLTPVWTSPKVAADSAFWAAFGFNGYYMLCLLLSLDPATGLYDDARLGGDTGMMERVGADSAHWQMRDVGDYRTVQCSYQVFMLLPLLAQAGIHALHVSTTGHDPLAYWDPDLGKWVMIDPTYGLDYRLDSATGTPLSPEELVGLSYAGETSRIYQGKTIVGSAVAPAWATGPFVDPSWDPLASYFGPSGEHPTGMRTMGSQKAMQARWSETEPYSQPPLSLVQVDLPDLPGSPFDDPAYTVVPEFVDAFPVVG